MWKPANDYYQQNGKPIERRTGKFFYEFWDTLLSEELLKLDLDITSNQKFYDLLAHVRLLLILKQNTIPELNYNSPEGFRAALQGIIESLAKLKTVSSLLPEGSGTIQIDALLDEEFYMDADDAVSLISATNNHLLSNGSDTGYDQSAETVFIGAYSKQYLKQVLTLEQLQLFERLIQCNVGYFRSKTKVNYDKHASKQKLCDSDDSLKVFVESLTREQYEIVDFILSWSSAYCYRLLDSGEKEKETERIGILGYTWTERSSALDMQVTHRISHATFLATHFRDRYKKLLEDCAN